jgi:hypothetical protein
MMFPRQLVKILCSSLFLGILFVLQSVQSTGYVETQISDIGNGVEQNFAFHPDMGRVRQKKVLNRLVQSYYNPSKSGASELTVTSGIESEYNLDPLPFQTKMVGASRRPSRAQIVYLLRNSRNPYPSALTRAKVIMSSGTGAGVSGVINLKQMVNPRAFMMINCDDCF